MAGAVLFVRSSPVAPQQASTAKGNGRTAKHGLPKYRTAAARVSPVKLPGPPATVQRETISVIGKALPAARRPIFVAKKGLPRHRKPIPVIPKAPPPGRRSISVVRNAFPGHRKSISDDGNAVPLGRCNGLRHLRKHPREGTLGSKGDIAGAGAMFHSRCSTLIFTNVVKSIHRV